MVLVSLTTQQTAQASVQLFRERQSGEESSQKRVNIAAGAVPQVIGARCCSLTPLGSPPLPLIHIVVRLVTMQQGQLPYYSIITSSISIVLSDLQVALNQTS